MVSSSDSESLLCTPEEVRQLWAQLDATIPAEKALMKAEGKRVAQDLQAEGGHKFEGGGQKMMSIPLRLWIRWNQELPGCWGDQAFIDRFLRDNPEYCAPGYRPAPPPKFDFTR